MYFPWLKGVVVYTIIHQDYDVVANGFIFYICLYYVDFLNKHSKMDGFIKALMEYKQFRSVKFKWTRKYKRFIILGVYEK